MIVISAMAVCLVLIVVGCTATGQPNAPVAQPAPEPRVSEPPQAVVQPPKPSETLKEPSPIFPLTTIRPGHWVIGPLTSSVKDRGVSYTWFDDGRLLVTVGDASGSIIDLQQGQVLDPSPIPIPPGIAYSHKAAIAPDLDQIAYMRPGELVIHERSTGQETTWKIGTSAVDSYYLWWSPDGRYLLGSQAAAGLRAAGDRVWYLDRQTGVIKGLIGPKADGLIYYECSWSPDGQQVVLRGGLPKESLGSAEYLWVNITSGETKVVVPWNSPRIEREFIWGPDGQLSVKNLLNGPGNSRPVPYDPSRKRYQDQTLYDGVHVTELHFLTYDRQVVRKIDLEPSLRAAGIPMGDEVTGDISATVTSDGRWVTMTGRMGPTEDTRTSFCGAVDLATNTIGVVRVDADVWTIGEIRGDRALVYGQQLLAEYDLKANKLTPLVTGQYIASAYRDGDEITYFGSQEIGIVSSDGNRQVLLRTGEGESLGNPKLSPSQRYVVVARTTIMSEARSEALEILELGER